MNCCKCEKMLSADEISLTRKLIHRNCSEFMCIECMAKYFKVDKNALYEKIKYFKQSGCILFGK